MDKPLKLYKTTCVIWSDFDPQQLELSALAREAESGDAYCSSQDCVIVENAREDPDWDGTEFFDNGFDCDDEEEDEENG